MIRDLLLVLVPAIISGIVAYRVGHAVGQQFDDDFNEVEHHLDSTGAEHGS